MNDNILDAKRLILQESEFFNKVTPDEMMTFIDEHYKEHSDMHESHYCKNIKIHTVQGFTSEEKDKLYNERILSDVWDLVIIPSIDQWILDNKSDGSIYTKGRSGGWLYCDKAKTLDFDSFGPKEQSEDDDQYEDRIYPLKNAFERLWYMQKWYDIILKDVKEYLMDVDIELEVKDE
jgi:hypothetical protein